MPFFSIVIPLYNKQKDIAATLESVFAQTFTDYEVIVINDGSTDGSEAEVLRFEDNRLVYRKTENQGVSQARNTGIALAKGDYIAFLDADDLWNADHLYTLQQIILQYPEAGLYATNYSFIHPKGKIEYTDFSKLDVTFSGIVDNVFKHSMKNRLIITISIAIKKEAFTEVGMFDPAIKTGPGEDTEMWIRIALKYPVAFTTKVTAYYNLKGSNRISLMDTRNRIFPRLDAFADEEKADPHLKKYLDLYRVFFALKHKLAGNITLMNYYQSMIDIRNLPAKTRILLKMPTTLLKGMFRLKQLLKRAGIHVDPYA